MKRLVFETQHKKHKTKQVLKSHSITETIAKYFCEASHHESLGKIIKVKLHANKYVYKMFCYWMQI